MKKVVTIGGGTGTFVVLSALKQVPNMQLSAIVTTSDDGGSTGKLRDAYGFLPMGDARQALVALSADGERLRELFAYRFEKGDVVGHNLGNLFLTALTNLLGSESEAIKEAGRLLRVNGYVIPATDGPTVLEATLSDGSVMTGEHAVTSRTNTAHIQSIRLAGPAHISDAARRSIVEADVIILGPGTLYASTIAPLLAEGMKEAIAATSAKLVYVGNLFTKHGHSKGFPASKHVQEVEMCAGRTFDRILVHSGEFTKDVLAWYAEEGEHPVEDDLGTDPRVVRVGIASVNVVPPVTGDPLRRSLMRHDPDLLRDALLPLIEGSVA